MRPHPVRAWRSRRIRVVLLFGVLFVLIGFGYLGVQDQLAASPAAMRTYRAHLKLMSLDGWAWAFVACGAVALAAGVWCRDTLGFTVLMAVSSWWGFMFIASWLITGYDRAVISALVWLLIVGVLAIVAGWDDPLPHVPRR